MAEAWRNANYQKRVEIAVQATNIDANLSGFPALAKLADTSLSGGAGIVNADLASKRYELYETGNATPLAYDEESYTEGATYANFETWVAVTTLYAAPTGDQNKVWLYYGTYDPGSDQDDAATVWADYLAVWHMNEASGDLVDATGNGYPAADTGTPDYQQAAKIGYGVNLSGVDEYFEATADAAWDMAAAFSVEGWFKSDAPTVDKRHQIYSGTDGWTLLQDDSSNLWKFFVFDGGAFDQCDSDGAPDNNWVHIAGIREADDTVAMYRDGARQSDTGSRTGTITVSGSNWVIGGRYSRDGNLWDGLLDEMRIRNGLPTNHGAWFKFQHANVNEADNELTWGSEETPSGGPTFSQLMRHQKYWDGSNFVIDGVGPISM